NAIQSSFGGNEDAFLCKILSDGSAYAYSTFLGGSEDDAANSIAVDGIGHAYLTGYTFSTDFPTASPLYSSNQGIYDAFVTKIGFASGDVALCCGITLSPASLPNGLVGLNYNHMVSATGGTGPYTFSITAGALPDGLTLSPGGAITGTP